MNTSQPNFVRILAAIYAIPRAWTLFSFLLLSWLQWELGDDISVVELFNAFVLRPNNMPELTDFELALKFLAAFLGLAAALALLFRKRITTVLFVITLAFDLAYYLYQLAKPGWLGLAYGLNIVIMIIDVSFTAVLIKYSRNLFRKNSLDRQGTDSG
ncbi:MAG: hypothetical protein ACR2P3_07625 [Geminicoccaceae bacterium]